MVNIKGRSKIITVIFSVVIAVSMLAVPMPGAVGAEKAEAKTSSSKYYIAVNKRANVATVYVLSRGKYRPFRAMLVSCGGSKTPSGTFRIGGKRRWGLLIHNLKGQYCTTITGQILFHSVWYSKYSPSTQSRAEYNKLGKTASAGCVRLAVIDAKWIYDNCPAGTKVRIYSSSNPGPLGKPTRVTYKTRSRYGWDPTDPAKGNPKFCLRPPVLTISKSKKSVVEYGQAYNLKYGVTAKNPNALQNITNEVTIPEMYRYRRDTKTWVRTKLFSTKSIGQYKIKYSVKDRYCRGTKTAYFKVTVRDSAYPSVSVAK
ncbi:MAG: L,D-transpeptidase, partial [Anaerovoracaceae bacterium]|nr:L,D-transpeptidase [Anaerovoracaceae bacterium]